MNTRGRRESGQAGSANCFTLVELLLVIAVISLFLALLLPALSGAKARANNTACKGDEEGERICTASSPGLQEGT